MEEKRIIVMRGPSGCGKSSWLKEKYPDAYVCSADDFWWKPMSSGNWKDENMVPSVFGRPIDYRDGCWHEYIFDSSKQAQAHESCRSRVVQRMVIDKVKGESSLIAVDNTNIAKWQYEMYIDLAILAEYAIRIVEFRPKTIEEINLCASRNAHYTPVDVVRRMCCEFEDDLRATVVPIQV